MAGYKPNIRKKAKTLKNTTDFQNKLRKLKKSPLQQKTFKSIVKINKKSKIRAPRCVRTRFPIPAKSLRESQFCTFSTPLVRKRVMTGSEKRCIKSALFCRRKNARRRKYAPRARRCDFLIPTKPERERKFPFLQYLLFENAYFEEHCKTRLKVIVFQVLAKIVKNRVLSRGVSKK